MPEESEIPLKLSSREGVPSFTYELKIPNFFTLTLYDGTVFESPTFDFANATWGFRFYTEETWLNDEGDTDDYAREFSVSMVRLKSDKTQAIVFYKVMLLNAYDEKYDEEADVGYYKEDDNSHEIAFFNNDGLFCDRRDALSIVIHLFTDKLTAAEVEQLEYIDSPTEITKEQTNGCTVSLKILPISFTSSVLCTLSIPNFFTLPEYDGTVYTSKTFAFANAAWCFEVSSTQTWRTYDASRRRRFKVHLVKLDCEITKLYLSSVTTLLDGNDKEYHYEADTDTFYETMNCSKRLAVMENDVTPFDERDNLTLVIRLFSHEVSPEQRKITDKDTKALFRDFRKLFLTGQNYDLRLKVADKEFLVHRAVLMARSPVFLAKLSHDMVEKNDGFIDLPDCEPRAMEQFLFYVYTGKVENLNLENALGLYCVAGKYSVTLLKDQCSEFIKKSLSPSLVCGAIQLALDHSDDDLLECVTGYFVNRVSDILPTPEWKLFMQSNFEIGNKLLLSALKMRDDAMK